MVFSRAELQHQRATVVLPGRRWVHVGVQLFLSHRKSNSCTDRDPDRVAHATTNRLADCASHPCPDRLAHAATDRLADRVSHPCPDAGANTPPARRHLFTHPQSNPCADPRAQPRANHLAYGHAYRTARASHSHPYSCTNAKSYLRATPVGSHEQPGRGRPAARACYRRRCHRCLLLRRLLDRSLHLRSSQVSTKGNRLELDRRIGSWWRGRSVWRCWRAVRVRRRTRFGHGRLGVG
mmetsp:Transcript_1335/g.4191  ORF Transcript_1335/g.4191 Transcript_1335/m.4191 type:complete len:237 (+) Transcript_1335:667-1377(+)